MVWKTMRTKIHLLEICIVLYFILMGNSSCADASDCRICKVARVHKMKAMDCYQKELKQFPRCMQEDSEVLEMSVNRIRKLTKADLGRFRYLKVLYLGDNLLVNLDDDLFEDAQSLQTVDMSINAILNVPVTLLQLPYLTSLYLNQNSKININDGIERAKPIKSPLTQVDISQTTDDFTELPKFPNFGPMPYLVKLNISQNRYSAMSPKDFMGLCSLQILGNNNVTAEFENACECWTINQWLTDRNVKFQEFPCPIIRLYCKNITYKPEHLVAYEECQKMVAEIQRQQRIYHAGLGFGIAAAVLLLIGIVIFLWYRNKRNNERKKDYGKATNIGLLNNQTKSVPNEYVL